MPLCMYRIRKDIRPSFLSAYRRDFQRRPVNKIQEFKFAVENQEEVHYAMPIRSMLYDAMNYSQQVSTISKRNRRQKKFSGSAEYLSGFRKTDRVFPVISLVFYYGQEWNGSKDIYGLLDLERTDLETQDKELLKKYIPNYRMNLIQAVELAENNSFKTDLQWMMGMLKYKEDKKELVQYMKEHVDYFGNINEEEFETAKVLLGSRNIPKVLSREDGNGGIDMCRALDDWYQDGVNEGIARGIERGEERFRRLCLRLSEMGSRAELEKVLRDKEYCRVLHKKYSL